MKSKPVHGTSTPEHKRSWFIDFNVDWSDLWPWAGRNWRNFTLVKAWGELDHMTGRWVIEFGLLGLNITVTHVYDHRFNMQMLSLKDQIIEELKADTGATTVKDPLGLLDQLPKIH